MSDNITIWKTKELDGLQFSIKEICGDWHIEEFDPLMVSLYPVEDGRIYGELDGEGILHVKEISLTGNYSGYFLYNNLVLALTAPKTKGKLHARVVFESGSIEDLYAEDGKFREVLFEL